jgi:hypothetical protein
MFAVLLELRTQGPRDLLRVQRGPLLRPLLPAQRLGEPPPDLFQGKGAPSADVDPQHDGAPYPPQPERDGQVQEVTLEEGPQM